MVHWVLTLGMTISLGQLGCVAGEGDDLPGAGGKADHTGAAADAGPAPAGEMVRVPGGPFIMGCDGCGDEVSPGADEQPAHQVLVSEFDIDLTEVTQAAYAACVAASACTEPASHYSPLATPNLPVRSVAWKQAADFCAWAGKRLPTEAEWEKAARGTDGRLFPWGDDETFDCARANVSGCGTGVRPVGQAPAGASPYGALDMAGNVWEWVHDFYDPEAYLAHDGADPLGPESGTRRVYRGGSSGNLLTLARASNRAEAGYHPDVGGSGLGFRCAASIGSSQD
jgi:formylglycine-generating enzyme required for sulfatase activity